MLTDKQISLIGLIIDDNMTLKDAFAQLDIPASNYYYWMKNNKEFIQFYNDAIELKVSRAKQGIKRRIDTWIDRLDELSATSDNHNARVNSIAKLLNLGELNPQFKQEIVVKQNDSESKNYLYELLEQQKKDKQEEE